MRHNPGMKRLIPSLLVALAVQVASAQFSVDWFKVAGGGGAATGSAYAVVGTVGQTDPGQMTGGQFSFVGGFWSLLTTAPEPGAPVLTIAATTTNTILICWPSPSTGFELQENTDLRTGNWLVVPQTPTDNGTSKCVSVSPQGHNVFYRLAR